MDRGRFVREAEAVGIPAEQAATLYERLYATRAPAVAARPGRLLLGAVWFGVALIAAASAWWATLLDAPSGGALALLAVWLAGFAAAAEVTFRRGQRLLCGGLAVIAIGYVVAVVGMAFDLADTEPNSFSDAGGLALSAGCLVLALLALARYRRPVVALAVALAGASLLGGLLDLLLGETASALLAGAAVIAAGTLLDLSGWRRFAGWPHLVGAAVVGTTVVDHWDGTGAKFVLVLVAGALGLGLARVGYLIAGIVLLVWITIDVTPRELLPVISLAVGLGVLACVIVLFRRGNVLEPWLERHDLRRRQRDLGI